MFCIAIWKIGFTSHFYWVFFRMCSLYKRFDFLLSLITDSSIERHVHDGEARGAHAWVRAAAGAARHHSRTRNVHWRYFIV